MGVTRILQVPYLVQPDPTWCQSTVLKMMAIYLDESVLHVSSDMQSKQIKDIWNEVNHGAHRPDKQQRNSLANMKWWLQSHYPTLKVTYSEAHSEDAALDVLIRAINSGFPVLLSVSHTSTLGHIILAVGYENYEPLTSQPDFHLVIHDPYGRFDPTLKHRLFAKNRFDQGSCQMGGGQLGVGRYNRIPVTSARRARAHDAAFGTYRLMFCSK